MNEMIAQNELFTACRLAEGVIRITGLAGEHCFLLEGSDRALLIDGLTGVGSLLSFARELTSLPITIALTHGHMDHSGAAWESESVCLHPDDNEMLESAEDSGVPVRFGYYRICEQFGGPMRTKVQESDFLPHCKVTTVPLLDGDVIELGGRQVTVIAVPGHTRGTLVFLDRNTRIVFSGDACNVNTLMNLRTSATIEEYLAALHHWKEYEGEFDVMYGGHDPAPVPKRILDDAISLCKRIMERTDDKIPVADSFGGASLLAAKRLEGYATECGSLCDIVYKEDRIFLPKN